MDVAKYLDETEHLLRRRLSKCSRLFLEVGGHLLFDGHASRVLPNFDPATKLHLLLRLQESVGIQLVLCAHAKNVRAEKVEAEAAGLVAAGLRVSHVVVTRCRNGERPEISVPGAETVHHDFVEGYPSPEAAMRGFERTAPLRNISAPLVIVMGLMASAGKLATCLAQLYHDKKARYSKLELFPIWSLPVDHPVNDAYVAATADIGDFCCVDPYDGTATNYNRDVEAFPLLRSLMERIYDDAQELDEWYKSPTSMGVNVAGSCITDDAWVRWASLNEIARRRLEYRREGNAEAEETCRKLQGDRELVAGLRVYPDHSFQADSPARVCGKGAGLALRHAWAHFEEEPSASDKEWLAALGVNYSFA